MYINNEDLYSVVKKIKEVTGVDAYYNDKAETTSSCKFDLNYRGASWLTGTKKAFARFDLILSAGGTGAGFVMQMIDTELTIAKAFNLVNASDKIVFDIDNSDKRASIALFWNDDEAKINIDRTELGVTYDYKRYFTLHYYFNYKN